MNPAPTIATLTKTEFPFQRWCSAKRSQRKAMGFQVFRRILHGGVDLGQVLGAGLGELDLHTEGGVVVRGFQLGKDGLKIHIALAQGGEIPLLAAAGLSMDDAVKITVYVPDIRDFPKINMAYANFFKGRRMPARTAVGVPNLPMPGARVSIDVIAKTRD